MRPYSRVQKTRRTEIVTASLNAPVSYGNPLMTTEGGPGFGSNVVLGLVPGYYLDTKFGRNNSIGTATVPEDVWHGGGEYTGHALVTPETVEVFSSDGADAPAGSGALTIRFHGLKTNASTEYVSEDVTLNGVTAVPTSTTWWRINRAYVLTAGGGGANVGTLTIRHTTTTANVFAVMPAGANQTQIAAYTVPAGSQMLIKHFRFSITRSTGAAGSANVTLRAREPGSVFRAIRNLELQTGSVVDVTSAGGVLLPAGTDVKFRVESVSDNGTIADGSFEYFLIE